ncbi:MAG: hypothetical protein AAF802_28230 [Planctomycetota bacterium]
MRKKTAIGCMLGGVIFGVGQAFVVGLGDGLLQGIFMGIALFIVFSWLPKSRWLLQQSQFPGSLELPGEVRLASYPANLVIRPSDHGLKEMKLARGFWIFGMKGRESLGGTLHLTNHRLLFCTHRLNRVTGHASLFLSTINAIHDRSVFIAEKLAFETDASSIEFFVNEPHSLKSAIESAIEGLGASDAETLKQFLFDHPQRAADALCSQGMISRLMSVFAQFETLSEQSTIATRPLRFLGEKMLEEFLGEPLTDRVDQLFRAYEKLGEDQVNDERAA